MKGKAKTPSALDVSELEQLVEPLTVKVSKIKNGQFSPIPLPVGESGIPGYGWTKGEVLSLEQWLLNEWSGGGMYQVTVTDSSQPTTQKIDWKPFWDPHQYPEKIPPTIAQSVRPGVITQQPSPPQSSPSPSPVAAALAAPVQSMQATPQQGVSTMSQFPGGLPTGGFLTQPMQLPQPQQQVYQFPTFPQYVPSYAYHQQQQQQAQQQQPQQVDRTMMLEQQLQQVRLESAQREHQLNLERERAANAATIQRLEQQISSLAAAITQQQAVAQRPLSTPEMEMLREQNRALQERIEREAERREAERRDREVRDMVTAMNTQIQQQIAQMTQQYQAMITAAQNKTDPMSPVMQLMMEQNRNSIEAMKEIARESSSTIEKLQSHQMSPREMIGAIKDASNGMDSITQKMTSAFGSALDMQQRVLESALASQGGGSEVIGVIREGVEGVKSLAERYVTSKAKETVSAHQAQSQALQAQAQAQAIQAQAQAAIAQANARALQPVPASPQPAPAPTPRPAPAPAANGLAGTHVAPAPTSTFADWQRQREAVAPPPPVRETVSEAERGPTEPLLQVVRPPSATEVAQINEEAWFGPLYSRVIDLRKAVDLYLGGLKRNPPRIEPNSASPDQVAQLIMAAIGIVTQNNIAVPAMIELLNEGNFQKFFNALLPNVPEQYRIDALNQLKAMMGVGGEQSAIDASGQEADDDETEDESDDGEIDDANDGEQHDDTRDGSVARRRAH